MQGFLDEAARLLYDRYGDEISQLRLIFPSRRSRIFFTHSLSKIIDKPIWQPRWTTLDELFAEATPLAKGENVRLISELYLIYKQYHKESFDKFYFWGEVLLADFDMIDKYRVDASILFSNIADIKELEADISYMSEEQLNIIAKFWSTFSSSEELSREKQYFLRVWKSLSAIYDQFRKRLEELGIGYTGMIQRSAVERLKGGDHTFSSDEQYVAVGFNALSECEKSLFDTLSKSKQIEFIWDTDDYYTLNTEQEAGLFIRKNIERYSSSFSISRDNFAKEKDIEVIAASSNVLQCKYASKIIEELAKIGPIDKETAIILTDENMLTPLLYALPSQAGAVNVTMGYPLKLSLSYSLVERLTALQSQARRHSNGTFSFYYADVIALLAHPYIDIADKELFRSIEKQITLERLISIDSELLCRTPLLSLIFRECKSWSELSVYLIEVLSAVVQIPDPQNNSEHRTEFIASITEHIAMLGNSLEKCQIELSMAIYLSLLRRQLQAIRIPFEGEPLEGLQVMGILETRNIDFKNVIILSMNDDNFPGNRLTAPSYVPYNLRAAYSIPTPEHHEGVYAYYFYRLIQRAEKVYMLYCSHADDKSTGEASRYIYQMDYESPFELKYRDVGVDVNLYEQSNIEIEKSGKVAQALEEYLREESPRTLSPSAINRYIACPMRFYFYHIAHLRTDDELSEDVDNSMFGNILHKTMQNIYKPLLGKELSGDTLHKIRSDREYVSAVVEGAIREVCKIRDSVKSSEIGGEILLIKDIITKYVADGVLRYDAAHNDFSTIGAEMKLDYPIALDGDKRIVLHGELDRVDKLASGALRVVDYKSGGNHLEFKSIDSLFNGSPLERQGHIIQTLTYSLMLHHSEDKRVVPSLYYVRFMHSEDYSPLLVDRSAEDKDGAIADIGAVSEEFEANLKATLSELFDCSTPFRQAEDREMSCTYCDFKDICRS